LAAAHVGMHHFADNGARADDGHLHDEIVKPYGSIARNGCHLCAAFDLKHADGVGFAKRGIDLGIILRKLGQIDRHAVVLGDECEAVFHHGHHAETEQIDLDESECGAVFFVPLHDGSTWHRRALQRHNLVEHALTYDHAARVLAQMSRQILHTFAEFDVLGDAPVLDVEPRMFE